MSGAAMMRCAAGELAALVQANFDACPGASTLLVILMSSVLPMVSPRRHAGRGRTEPEHRPRCQLTVIAMAVRVTPVRRVWRRELVREALRDAREFSLPGPSPAPPWLD